MRFVLVAAALLVTSPALAEEGLNFDAAKLCAWQAENNSMDLGECTSMEEEGKAAIAGLESAAAPERVDECKAEAKNYSGDSGYASYFVYAECLKSGPGNL